MTNPIHTFASPQEIDARRRGHGRATLADVAAGAGVTTMTVSRFLRSPEQVANHTAEKISQALIHTNYSPNLQAGSLASGRSRAVAVIVPNIAHSIFADTLHGLGNELQIAGLQMLVSSTGYSLAQEEQQVRHALGWAPTAVVLTGRKHLPATEALLIAAQKRGTPVVEIWDQSPAGEAHHFHQIGFDHASVGEQMAQTLIERGYSSLAFMGSAVTEDLRAHERGQAFLTYCKSHGLNVRLLLPESGDPIEQGRRCFAIWHSEQASTKTGIGFANDLLATGALLEAQSLKCRLPQAIGLLGFGDFQIARYCQGGLSTMQIDGERIGQTCAQYIIQSLRTTGHTNSAVQQMLIQPRLLWRGFEHDLDVF